MKVISRLTIAALCLLSGVFFAFANASESGEDATKATPENALKSSLRTGLTTRKFELDGFQRRYLFYTPRGAATLEGDRPLVLVIHGGGGTDRGMVRLTKRRWHRLADQHGFYVAYPNAVKKMWDFGEGEVSEALRQRIDDGAYFQSILEEMTGAAPIDETRIFATGISRGGQASFFLACKFPGQFKAIAPVTMPLPAFLEDDCREEAPPVGLALFNGTADPLVPYNGGEITVRRNSRGRVLSTDETIALWRARNGCADEPDSISIVDKSDDGMSVTRSDWTSCARAPVALFRIEGGGHAYPSGRQYLPKRIVGPVTTDIDGATETWAFFSQFE